MRVLKGLLAIALLAGSLSANAVPTTWVDTIDFTPDVPIGQWQSYPYQHDITDNGFTPFVDLITGATLAVNLYDDRDPFLNPVEIALIDVPSAPGLFGLLDGDRLFFDLSGSEFGGWSLVGYFQLLLTGKLDVTITSLWGDFYLGDSTLTAWGDGGSTSVPEPATLSMLGLGLLGLGFFGRRRKV